MGDASGLRAHRFTGGGLRELLDRQAILAGATAESRLNALEVTGMPPAPSRTSTQSMHTGCRFAHVRSLPSIITP
jgi:hypothetical protein